MTNWGRIAVTRSTTESALPHCSNAAGRRRANAGLPLGLTVTCASPVGTSATRPTSVVSMPRLTIWATAASPSGSWPTAVR